MSQRSQLSRRRFIQGLGLGAAAVGTPLMPSLTGHADTAAAPKRFLVFWTPNGLYEPEWTPSDSFELGRILAPLEAFKDRMLVLEDLDWQSYFADPSNPSNDHPPPLSHCLCATDVVDYDDGGSRIGDAWGGGPSIDQFIAQRLGAATRFESLLASVESGAKRERLSYRDAREWVPPEADPAALFDRLFADFDLDADELDRVRGERRSVLDLVRGELQSLQSRIGREDRYKLEAHLTHLRAVEDRIADEVATRSCAPPDLSSLESPYEYVRHGRQMMDLLASAFACDLTRVGFLEWDGALTKHQWLPGVDSAHHTYAHYNADGLSQEETAERLIRIGTWYGEQLAYLLQRLDEIPEGDGTVLDHTVVLWTSEQAAPRHSGQHARRNVPFLLAGSGGGHFRTGRKVDCRGRAHNDLYVSICHAMGLEEVTSFGNAEVCSGPLPDLTA